MANWKGTPVPSSGQVDKIYINTKLSKEEVVNICDNLTFVDGSSVATGFDIWSCATNSDLTNGIMIARSKINPEIYAITVTSSDGVNEIFFSTIGWTESASNVFEFNTENQIVQVGSLLGFTPENEKASMLFSITPFKDVSLNSFLTSIADAIRSKKGTTDKINASNFASEIAGISGGGGAVVKTIGGWHGTTVPNSGYVENVYVNTSLSIAEVTALLDNIDISTETYQAYIITNEEATKVIGIMDPSGFGDYEGYIIFGQNADGSPVPILNTSSEEVVTELFGITFTGWYADFTGVYEFKDNTIKEFTIDGTTLLFGDQNNKLSTLFSTTPFEMLPDETTTLSGEYDGSPVVVNIPNGYEEGTIVPNTGVVEKVYFNTNLSTTEVKNIMNTLTYNYSNVFEHVLYNNASNSNDKIVINLAYTQGVYVIMDNKGNIYFNTNPDADVNFVGWNPEFNGIITINSEVVDVYDGTSVGTQNDKITSLFSITPFNPIIPEINIKSYVKEQKLPVQFNLNIDKTALIPKDYIVPEGVVEITENGTYDVTKYESANINVTTIPEGYFKPEGTRNIIYNGTYDVNRYAKVNVNVDTLIPEGTADITTTEPVNVYYQAYAQVKDDNLIPENIRKDISVLGITGTLDTDDEIKRAEAKFIGDRRFGLFDNTYVNKYVWSIDDYAFANNRTITEINETNFPNCQNGIGIYAFYNTKLFSISLPKVNGIYESAFENSQELQIIDFPKVTLIEKNAFYLCINLLNINLPLVETIEDEAFACTPIQSIRLQSLKTLGNKVFWGCHRLVEVYLGGSTMVTLANANSFNMEHITSVGREYANVHVRAELLSEYQADTVWAEAVTLGYVVLVGDYTD